MKTLLTIAIIVVFIVILILLARSYYLYYRSYDNISPITLESISRFIKIILYKGVYMLTTPAYKLWTISYYLFFVLLILIGVRLFMI